MGIAEKFIPGSFDECAKFVLVSQLAVAGSLTAHYLSGLRGP